MKSNDKQKAAAWRTCLLLTVAAPLWSSGPYIGGGLGKTRFEDAAPSRPGGQFSESARSWKAFIGYRYDAAAIFRLASETGFRDSGRAEAGSGPENASYRIKGWDYVVLGIVPLGRLELFGKVGGFSYSLDSSQGGVGSPANGIAFLYGGGAGVQFSRLGIRLEYDRADVHDVDRNSTVWLLLQTRN